MTKHITVSGVFVKYNNKLLFLKRVPTDYEGNTWGLPAGRNQSELPIEAAVRTLQEETGIRVTQNELEYKGTWLWKFPEIDISFPTYLYEPETEPSIILEPQEHYEYSWMSIEDYLAIDTAVHGTKNLIRMVFENADPATLDEDITKED